MSILDRYRPQTLSEVVGQPAVRRLERFARAPCRSSWLLHGGPGIGKSASAHALAHDLSCGEFAEYNYRGSDLGIDVLRELFGHTLRFRPLDGSRFTVLIIEELERCVSAAANAWLKVALDDSIDANEGLPIRCVVVATSNDIGAVDPALLERFHVLEYWSGGEFAELAQPYLCAVWAAETSSALPPDLSFWGWQGGRYSLRQALRQLQDALIEIEE